MKKKCLLCKKNEANQPGSHLTSCFIVASLFGKRGEEKAYEIIADPNQDYFENKEASGIKEDYILCAGCEKRLSFVETYFSQELTNKIGEPKYSENFPITEIKDKHFSKFLSCKNVNSIAFHLLIYSIIWRASISNNPMFSGFKLESKVEENLRFVLDLYLPEYKDHNIVPKLKQWLKDLDNVPDFFTLYPYVILRAEEEDIDVSKLTEKELEEWEKRKTKNLLYFAFEDNQPYHIILNEFIILVFFNEGKIDYTKQDYFELSDKYDLEGQMNKTNSPPKIGMLKHEDWSRINQKILDAVANQRIKNIRRECVRNILAQRKIPNKDEIDDCVNKKIEIRKMK